MQRYVEDGKAKAAIVDAVEQRVEGLAYKSTWMYQGLSPRCQVGIFRHGVRSSRVQSESNRVQSSPVGEAPCCMCQLLRSRG